MPEEKANIIRSIHLWFNIILGIITFLIGISVLIMSIVTGGNILLSSYLMLLLTILYMSMGLFTFIYYSAKDIHLKKLSVFNFLPLVIFLIVTISPAAFFGNLSIYLISFSFSPSLFYALFIKWKKNP